MKNQDNDDEGDDSESDEDQTCVMETSASHSETFSLKRSQRRVRSLAAGEEDLFKYTGML